MKVSAVLITVLALSGVAMCQYDYASALSKSILFYEAQRSGNLGPNNRIPWRGNTFLPDGSDNGVDLSGGYFDAGDHVKFGFPFGHSMIFIAWGLIDYRAGYSAAGELDNGLATLKWGTDWIIKATQLPNAVYGQAGDGNADHAYWGRPEDQNQNRPSFRVTPQQPGSDLCGNYASAMALASVAFAATDPTYAAQCLAVARQLYDFAKTYRGKYTVGVPADAFYGSYSPDDELVFAAAAMALATDEQTFKTDAAQFYTQYGLDGYLQTYFDWDNKHMGVHIILARILGDQKYKTAAQSICDAWMNTVPKTPKGLMFLNQWGSLRHAANAAFGCLLAADSGIGNVAAARAFAKQQIDYMLGSSGRSFVVGFGVNPPVQPHHRASSCQNPAPAPCDWADFNSPNPNGNVLNGALVGGPNQNDQYTDSRGDFTANEVAIDYNAGFQSALAALVAAGY